MADEDRVQEHHPAAVPASRAKSGVNRRSSTTSKSGHTSGVSGRAAARKVDEASHITLNVPLLGAVRLPEPQRLTYYAAIGALGVLGVLEWPVALVLAGGTPWPRISTTALCSSSVMHSKTPEHRRWGRFAVSRAPMASTPWWGAATTVRMLARRR